MEIVAERVASCCELVADVLRESGEVKLKLYGTSMLPAVWPGDMVTVRCCSHNDLRPGQILMYRGEGIVTAHRLLQIRRRQLILRGDSLPCCDPPVDVERVLGKVTAISREGRPVSSEQTILQRATAFAIRRSELCRYLTLRLGADVWSFSQAA